MRSNQDDKDLNAENSEESSKTNSEITSSSSDSSASSNPVTESVFIQDPKEQFTYENMVENFIVMKRPILGNIHGEFAAARLPGSIFINFGYQDSQKEHDVGWKAHISIDDSDKENLAKAWNLVKDILIDEQLVAKVVLPHADFYKDPDQCGKQITIYCHMTPEKNWEDVFHKIENALSVEDIQDSEFSSSDRPLPGSVFLSYRNDDNGRGEYIASDNDYNPANHDDIFANIELQPRGVRFR
jgi:hypothetical protein